MKIAIDAGHNPPKDFGVLVNAAGDFTYNYKLIKHYNHIEYIWNRRIVTELQSMLIFREHQVLPFCGNLAHKVRIINRSMCDIAIEIHHDANTNKRIRGGFALYHPGSKEGKKLSEFIANSIEKSYKIRGIYPGYMRLDETKPILYFIRKTQMPAILIECATLTNVSDRHEMTRNFYVPIMAKRIVEGIEEWIKEYKRGFVC